MKSNGKYDYEESAEVRNVTGWTCKECGRWWGNDEHMARWCCAKTEPCSCGGRVDSGWTACKECRAKNEAGKESARFAKAEKVTEFDGPIWIDGVTQDDGFFETLDDLIDFLSYEDMEIPNYVYTCTLQQMPKLDAQELIQSATEEMHESAYDAVSEKTIDELQHALNEFWESNKHVVSWEIDYKKVLLISKDVRAEILKAREDGEE